MRKRDELAVLNERLRSLDATVANRVDPAGVIEYLTQVLPDDTHLYSLDIQKAKITASGHTVDASALLQKLSSDPRLKDVRSPTAVTRLPGATKEAFTVEFTMDMKQVPLSPPSAPAAASPWRSCSRGDACCAAGFVCCNIGAGRGRPSQARRPLSIGGSAR